VKVTKIWTAWEVGEAGVTTTKLVEVVLLPVGETAGREPNATEMAEKEVKPAPVKVTVVPPTHGPDTGAMPVIPAKVKSGAPTISAEPAYWQPQSFQ